MRNGLIGLASTMVLASAMATVACADYDSNAGTGGTASTAGGSSSSGGTSSGGQSTGGGSTGGNAAGGSPGSGGTSSTGGTGPVCSNGTPCGGSVVGTWSVQSSTCLTVAGQLDMSSLGIDCKSAPITGGSLQVTGTWTANTDGTYSDNTTTTGDVQVQLPDTCKKVSGTTTTCDALSRSAFSSLGFASATCTDATDGGCTCQAHVNQTGGIGVLNVMATTGAEYTTSGTTLSISDGRNQITYDYCATGNTLTLHPTWTKTGTTTGTIVLQKQ